MKINKVQSVNGEIKVPADKSVTHRSVMLGSLAEGKTVVKNYLPSDDCLRTMNAFRLMGVDIEQKDKELIIKGAGINGLKKPSGTIYAGNSGTTARLLLGILAGQKFDSDITGDESLSSRPMKRVIEPLRLMGAGIEANSGNYLPLDVKYKGILKPIDYISPVASAQIKSCILFAGLYAGGTTSVTETEKSRDHTEIMMKAFGADVSVDNLKVSVKKCDKLYSREISVPSDISSAAFFLAAGLLLNKSNITVREVGINPTRDGIIEVLGNMGARLEINNVKTVSGEQIADITVYSSQLKAVNIDGKIIPRLVDEIPVLVLCATQASGITVISGAKELRVKESDRLKAIATQLNKMGADIEEKEDGLIIRGKTALKADFVDSFKDHRIAMTLAVAALIAEGTTEIKDAGCVNISFPDFYEVLKAVCR